MVATPYHKVLSRHDAQPVPVQPVEWWTDRNGQRWQRISLGDVAAGYLVLGAVRSSYGSISYGAAAIRRNALCSAIRSKSCCRDSWERFSRKSGRHQMHRVAGRANGDVGMWWLALLPLLPPRWRAGTSLSRYMIESRLGGGAELFRLLPPPIRRPKGATIRLELP
jgi:hypothetical protein